MNKNDKTELRKELETNAGKVARFAYDCGFKDAARALQREPETRLEESLGDTANLVYLLLQILNEDEDVQRSLVGVQDEIRHLYSILDF